MPESAERQKSTRKRSRPYTGSQVKLVVIGRPVIADGPSYVISTPENVWELPVLRELMDQADREIFVCLHLSTKNRLISWEMVSIGSLNASIVHPRELFKGALLANAASVVVAHNHPSGDPTPSGADIQLTRRLGKAGDVLGIDVLDHVIFGEDGVVSMRDLGLM